MVSVLVRHHSFGAHAVAAIGMVCVYPADAIADCWFSFDVFWQVCEGGNCFTKEFILTAATTPVNKVIRNNTTRSEQNDGKVTTRTTSTKQSSLGKDRVRLPRCTQLTSQYHKVTQLIMPNATWPYFLCICLKISLSILVTNCRVQIYAFKRRIELDYNNWIRYCHSKLLYCFLVRLSHNCLSISHHK